MTSYLYRITCLTNLYVGSGDINFNIVDNEVEKDPTTGYPMIHASGLKGAIRSHCENNGEGAAVKAAVNELFGKPATKEDADTAGRLKFLDAYMLMRPMRLAESTTLASIPVTTLTALRQYVAWRAAFDPSFNAVPVPTLDFGNNAFLITPSQKGARVEGDSTGVLTEEETSAIRSILGVEDFAIGKDLTTDYPLPVVARNQLENGVSKNLWYEEIVPHGTVFYFAVLDPQNNNPLTFDRWVQIGGNASVGCGYCQIKAI